MFAQPLLKICFSICGNVLKVSKHLRAITTPRIVEPGFSMPHLQGPFVSLFIVQLLLLGHMSLSEPGFR